jgi:hypothetical protein
MKKQSSNLSSMAKPRQHFMSKTKFENLGDSYLYGLLLVLLMAYLFLEKCN